MKNLDVSNSLPTTAKDQFILFPNLAAELQLQIWSFAIPDPQIIKIKPIRYEPEPSQPLNEGGDYSYRAKAFSQVPAVLHTCHNSRIVALSTYRLSFEERLIHPVYFNCSRDTLFMISYRALEAFSGTPWEEGFEDVKGVRSVIVGGPQFVATEYVLGTFDDLESVIIERPKMISEELIALKVGRVCSTWKTRHVKIGGRSAEDIILKPPIVRFLSLEELRAMGAKA